MREIHESTKQKLNCFVPDLIDVIIPQNEKDTKSLRNVFMILEYQE